MSKAYSNKALPAGTVLREWRLEQVLGVGGFGIVYKGRGIYFDELVAIKEYFPSSISERDEDATVVPIDSDAEEVHALGLKKFVEEAKLLWNLSTPSRHPNIVSVRSLFEIHGTAYMVMDFEDGVSLSKMLKSGKKFNEASLSNIIMPIARGLERAHRVGVLHRDIKPPNIIVNDDGRAVLIDFGSARFESGDATSTKVTFHTPPYAAIEQYVRTYEQGPWTDIYALGVVMYECITGSKPAEVLERMHGEKGKPLVEGEYPGFSDKFLAAVDAAMTIRPDERPQSISQWLDLFDKPDETAIPTESELDDDATRIAEFDTMAEKIIPVAPLEKGFKGKTKIETGVPESPSKAEFKKRGKKADAAETKEPEVVPVAVPEAREAAVAAAPAKKEPAPKKTAKPPKDPAKSALSEGLAAKKLSPTVLAGGAAAVLLVLAVGGWTLFSGGKDIDEGLLEPETVEKVDISGAESLVAALRSLDADAQKASVPADAQAILTGASDRLESEVGQGSAGLSEAKTKELFDYAKDAAARFAASLRTTIEGRAARIGRDLAWANPAKPNAARAEPANRQSIARNLSSALAGVRKSADEAASAADPGAAVTSARQAMVFLDSFDAASRAAYRAGGAKPSAEESASSVTATQQTTEAPAQAAEAATTTTTAAEAAPASAGGVSAAKKRDFTAAISRGRDLARQVVRLGDRDKPGSSASSDEQEGYRLRQANAKTARDYQKYLDTLEASMRGTTDDEEASRSIIKANQTESYLRDLLRRSNATLN